MKKSIKKIVDWVKHGNDCSKCPASWSEYSIGCDEWDGGCFADRHDGEGWECCRLPRPVVWYLSRRTKYFMAHEYDGLCERMMEDEEIYNIVYDSLETDLRRRCIVICVRNRNGELSEVEDPDLFVTVSMIQKRFSEYLSKTRPRSIKDAWKKAIKDTFARLTFVLKSYFYCE